MSKEKKGEEAFQLMMKETEETSLQKGIEHLIENSNSFAFLKDEEDLYTLDDLKEKY